MFAFLRRGAGTGAAAAVVILALPLIGFAAAAAVAVPAVTFTLYDNGASTGGVEVTLSPDDFRESSPSEGGRGNSNVPPPGEAFAVDMSRLLRVSKYGADGPVVGTRAYREDGELITEFGQLAPEVGDDGDGSDADGTKRRRVYLVADGLEFVWPFVSAGHMQVVSTRVLPPVGDILPRPVILESMSETPRVFRAHNLCSEEEAKAIIDNVSSLTGDMALKRSTVGESDVTDTRTSENAWDSESPTAKTLITRSFQLTNIEETAGKRDGLQIVRYKDGQGYNTHPDYFEQRTDDEGFDFNPYSGGSNRFATVFIYLNDVPEDQGGFTVFPRAPTLTPERTLPAGALDSFRTGSWQHRMTKECFSSLAVEPKMGTAALFYSITPDGRIDPSSHHGACPLLGGNDENAVKWGANIWLWNRQRYGEIRTGDPRSLVITSECDDDVYITWEKRDNGVIPPGQGINMNTFEYHRFKAYLGGYNEGKAIDEYTVESEPHDQRWVIRKPRVIASLNEQAEEEL